MGLRRRAEDATFATHGRTLACVVAAGLLAASPGGAMWSTGQVDARLAIDLDGFPTLALERRVEAEVEVDLGTWPYQRLAALDLPGGAEFQDFTSVEGTLFDHAFWFDADLFPDRAHFATDEGELGGAMSLLGFAYLCTGPCEEVDPVFTLPLDAAPVADPPFLSIGDTWTTGTIVSGGHEATGHNLAAPLEWTDVADPWWSVSLVTPVLLVLSAGTSVAGIARLDLSTWTPACADGLDDDGDERIDYPDDPGCSDENDLEEELELGDGALHEIDASVVPGEGLYVGGVDESPTRVRMQAPAELGRVQIFGGEFSMEGGKLRGALESFGGHATVSGGELTNIGVAFGGTVLLRGTGFNRPEGPVSEFGGRITGTLADGTPLDAVFWRDAEDASLVLPESGTVVAGVAAALALATVARAKR